LSATKLEGMAAKFTRTPEEHRAFLKRWRKRLSAPGRRTVWTAADAQEQKDGPHYERGNQLPIGVYPPTPRHAQTEAAEYAREAMAAAGAARWAPPPPDYDLVTKHPWPWVRLERDELPNAAGLLWGWGEAQGFEVAGRGCGHTFEVGIARSGVLVLRAQWTTRGLAGQTLKSLTARPARVFDGASWHLMAITAAKAVLVD